MTKQNNEIVLIDKIKKLFKKQHIVNKGDLGVYHYIWSCDTINDNTHGFQYDVFLKIKALEVYDNLVEIEVISVNINESASQDIINVIKSNLPKYVDPNYINWILKNEKTN